jgi:hypothetical protein
MYLSLVIAALFLAPAVLRPTLGRAFLALLFLGGALFNLMYTLPNAPGSLVALVATAPIPPYRQVVDWAVVWGLTPALVLGTVVFEVTAGLLLLGRDPWARLGLLAAGAWGLGMLPVIPTEGVLIGVALTGARSGGAAACPSQVRRECAGDRGPPVGVGAKPPLRVGRLLPPGGIMSSTTGGPHMNPVLDNPRQPRRSAQASTRPMVLAMDAEPLGCDVLTAAPILRARRNVLMWPSSSSQGLSNDDAGGRLESRLHLASAAERTAHFQHAVRRPVIAEGDALDQCEMSARGCGDPVVEVVTRAIRDLEQISDGSPQQLEAILRDALTWIAHGTPTGRD